MSLQTEIMRRAPVPFDYAKAQFEKANHCAIGDQWPAFLHYWAGLNSEAAEVFVAENKNRHEAFKAALAAAKETT